jgi:hypothetical protein
MKLLSFCAALAGITLSLYGEEQSLNGRQSIVLDSQTARVVVDLGGGAIREFRFKDSDLNPLSWNTPGPNDLSVHGFGHFLCLDRWGPPSDAEGKLGMPYHGEASNVPWTVETTGKTESVITARLPKAGLAVRRTVRISPNDAVFEVREEVTNENALGRMFNIVQHPTIAPPFLNESTLVDCNGRKGFAQGGSLPNPEEPSVDWPQALKKNGTAVDLRHLTNDPDPNVVSYAIDESFGWVTAANPAKGLLIGYVWRASDYPWVSLWRDVRDGQPVARGLEFGSTGLHQPFPILAKKGKIWERQLFEYIDARQTITKKYAAFLLAIPKDFQGVDSVSVEKDRLQISEKSRQAPSSNTIARKNFVITAPGIDKAL